MMLYGAVTTMTVGIGLWSYLYNEAKEGEDSRVWEMSIALAIALVLTLPVIKFDKTAIYEEDDG